jgi:hypothetical protein
MTVVIFLQYTCSGGILEAAETKAARRCFCQNAIIIITIIIIIIIISSSSSSSSSSIGILVVVSCHRPLLPGTSLEPAVTPTAQASIFTLQYFPYYV